ncbi:MAG: GIY-YIG nuclease family protein [Gammaproteobacteria bacterium]|nr:GIY-YIG nuclease family protein [Gammaproteobacteria bacterium]NNJ72754.1 GIY-YIG nuclease family protein [Enterobacterales bacterium]
MSVDLNPNLFTDLALGLQNKPLQGFPETFYILDCETTGGRALRDRMTELAWIKIEQGKITEHWHCLFDPEMSIPPWIKEITGISTRMVADAPRFADKADEIMSALAGEVIVAHNARFDYGFLKNEFKRLNKTFTAKTLCSVKLSRTLYPELRGHGLDKIIQRCNIQLESRHRAMSDVLAVLAFFAKVSEQHPTEILQEKIKLILKKPSLPSHLDVAEIDKLPDLPGVYYFYGKDDQLLYVGKSVEIQTRVKSHFIQDHQSATDAKLSRTIYHIDFQRTPSDFGAQLLESKEIKRLSPSYNQRLRRISQLYQIQLTTNAVGYLTAKIKPAQGETTDPEHYGLYRSQFQAKSALKKIATEHQLCHKLLGLEATSKGPCFGYQLHQCLGACCEQEASDTYNQRLLAALEQKKQVDWPWDGPILIKERDVADQDSSVMHLVDQWQYLGQCSIEDSIDLQEFPTEKEFDLDIYHILVRFLFNDASAMANYLEVIPLRRNSNGQLVTT